MIVQLLFHMYLYWERKTPFRGRWRAGLNLLKQWKTGGKNRKQRRAAGAGVRCYLAQLGGAHECMDRGGLMRNQWNVEQEGVDGRTDGGGVRLLLLLLLLLLVLTERGGWGVKTARREIRHESMKCTTKTKKAEMAVDVAGMGGGWGGRWRRRGGAEGIPCGPPYTPSSKHKGLF